jgi:Ca2+-binding EF-hand superfamily protein
MEISEVTNTTLQQVLDAFNPQESTSTSNSQATDVATQAVQGHHHHHHKRSMTDMISQMESTIADAAKEGKLTDDQATQMKKELDAISETLRQGQSSTGAQLTSDDLQKIREEFHGLRKQLFDALNPQGSASTSNGMDNLFKQLDVNGDGAIDKNEFSTFMSLLA